MPNDAVQEIKDRLSIADVVQSYIPLEVSGRQFRARCPFHNEKTPSFYVNPERQMFYCFGCQKGGDMFAFVQEIERLDFKEALKILADKAGVSLTDVHERKETNRMRELLKTAADVFSYCLKKSPDAMEYVKKRGITDASVADFGIGYALKRPNFLVSYLSKKGYSNAEMVAAGVAVVTQRNEMIDRFRGRVMFPLCDLQGRVTSFTGRILPKYDKEGIAKYMNGPDTALYHKSEILFGFSQAKESIRTEKVALLMEGQMDVVTAHQHGFKHAIAISGTALSEKHANVIKRYADKIIVCLDGDAAGIRAAERNIWPLAAAELEVSIAVFPKGEDPASLLSSGNIDAFKSAITNSISYVALILRELKNIPVREQYKKLSDHLYPWCRMIPNAITQDKILLQIADTLGVSPDAIRTSFSTWLFQEAGNMRANPADIVPKSSVTHEGLPDQLIKARVYAESTILACIPEELERAPHMQMLQDIVLKYQDVIPELNDPASSDEISKEVMRLAPMAVGLNHEEIVDFITQTIKVYERVCLETAYQKLRKGIGLLSPDDPDTPVMLEKMADLRKKIDLLSVIH